MADAARPAQALPAARPARVRAWLKRLHLWLGLSAGLAFTLVALSGTVLAFQRELLLWQHPELRRPLPDRAQLAAVLDALGGAARPAGLTALDLPTPALPVWQLYFADGARRYLDPQTGALLLTRTPSDDALLWLRELHTHLLAGARGEQVLGAVGLLALCLLLSGLWLAWPRRGALLASLRPHAQPPIRRWVSWHRSLGVLTLPLLLTVTATGTAMV
ncbi:MAG TPA: PepSY domain-containing protein, partial [Mizugakiibacter sp.]